jgi:hypothetical protein
VGWALTPRGYRIAEETLGRIPNVPRRDVGATFLEHTVTLNELFVALVLAEGGSSLQPATFRWIPAESAGLPFTEYERLEMRTRERLIQPDAILDLRAARRRIFLECEMGTHSIIKANDDAGGSTLAKTRRYEQFLTGRASLEEERTFYATAFADDFAPELVFLVHSATRRSNVDTALSAYRKGRSHPPIYARAWTLEDAVRELTPALRRSLPPATAPSAPAASDPDGLFLTRADLRQLFRFYDEAISTIRGVRQALRELSTSGRRPPIAEPPFPGNIEEIQELVKRIDRSRRNEA